MTWANVVYWLISILAAWQETAVCAWIVGAWEWLVPFVRWYWFEIAVLVGVGLLCGMKAVELWMVRKIGEKHER